MANEIEERIHRALSAHPLERIEDGYRRVHPHQAGISTLRLVPAQGHGVAETLHSVAEVVAEFQSPELPALQPIGVQRLNSWAVHGPYSLSNSVLRQTAQFSIYVNEPAIHLAVQTILNAFGSQLPIGLSTLLATTSTGALEQQRAHHRIAPQWPKPLGQDTFDAAAGLLRQHGLAASNDAGSVWAEVPLSGECPSRSIDPHAETALIQIKVGVPHPIAGAGYLANIALPLAKPPAAPAEICAALNRAELQEIDFVPRLGAWGLRGPDDMPTYTCFMPVAEAVPGLHMAIMWWCVRRANWLRERFWKAGEGVQVSL